MRTRRGGLGVWASFALLGCGSSAPHPEAPSEAPIPSASSQAKRNLPAPQKVDQEAPLPSACDRAAGKLAKAQKLLPQGYVSRAKRLAEQAAGMCPEQRSAATALVSQVEDATRRDAGQSGSDLWAKSEAAKEAGDLQGARRLASSAAMAFARVGTPATPWRGLAELSPIALSTDGALLAALSDSRVLLLHTRRLEPIRFLEASEVRNADAAHFSPDASRFGVLTSRGVELFDTKTGARLRTLSWAGERFTRFGFSKDGQSVLVGGEASWNATVRRFDVTSGDSQAEYQIPKGRGVAALAVSPRDGKLAIGLETGQLELLDGTKLTKIRALGDDKLERIAALSFSPVSDRVAVVSGNTRLDVLDTSTGKRVTKAQLDHSWGHSVCGFSSDGSRVRVNGGTWGDALMEIDAKDGHSLSAKRMPSRDQVLSPDASVLVASPTGGGMHVVDAKSAEVIAHSSTPSARLEGMAFTDGGLAVARELSRGSESRLEVLLVSARTVQPRFLTVPGYKAELAFSGGGERLAGHFGGNSVFLWDVAAADHRQDLPDFPEWVQSLSFASKSVLRAAGGPFELKLGTLSIGSDAWNIQATVRRKAGGQSVALSSGRAVVRQEDGLVSYDLTLREPTPQSLPGEAVRDFTLSGDGKQLFLVSDKGTSRVALDDSRKAELLSGHCTRGPIAASRDGSVAVTACTYRELAVFKGGRQITAPLEVNDVHITPSGEVIAITRNGSLSLMTGDLKSRVDVRFAGLGAAEATTPDGGLELFGEAQASDRFCIVDQRAYPFDLCEDQVLRDDLVVDALLPN